MKFQRKKNITLSLKDQIRIERRVGRKRKDLLSLTGNGITERVPLKNLTSENINMNRLTKWKRNPRREGRRTNTTEESLCLRYFVSHKEP